MEEITIDGMQENAFRRSIEDMLRFGDADSAAKRLRGLIEPYTGDGKALPRRFLNITPSDIALAGWGDLQSSIEKFDRPEHQVSALSLVLGEPEKGRARPDDTGLLAPWVETSYFSDEAYPFSDADRGDLLDGYSSFGCEWAGDVEGVDHALAVEGVDDLYGALVRLETRLLDSEAPGDEDIRAGTLGSCYLSVLIHQAVRETIRKQGLPRPLCVMAGTSGIYPFFDAPVMSSDEYVAKGVIVPIAAAPLPEPVDAADGASAAPANAEREEGSLLSLSVRPLKKKPVLMLDPAELENGLEAMATAQIMGQSYTMPAPVPVAHDYEPEVLNEPEMAAVEPELEPEAAAEPELMPEPEPEPVPEPTMIQAEPEVVPEAVMAQPEPEPAHIANETPTADEWAWPEREPEPAVPTTDDSPFEPWHDDFVATETYVQTSLAPGPEPESRGHSLRARFAVAEVVEKQRVSLWQALVDWVMAKLGRR